MSKETLGIIVVLVGIFGIFYFFLVAITALINMSNESIRCQESGNYFVYNSWSLGTSGECKEL